MDSDAELAIVRRAYAKQIMATAIVDDERVEAAFAAVRREAYLGPGPWPILRTRPDGICADPKRRSGLSVCEPVVGLLTDRDLNNGQPSLHAMTSLG
jgi:protein-L-isoaspartate(D-aspartate) O-methyltransferase